MENVLKLCLFLTIYHSNRDFNQDEYTTMKSKRKINKINNMCNILVFFFSNYVQFVRCLTLFTIQTFSAISDGYFSS